MTGCGPYSCSEVSLDMKLSFDVDAGAAYLKISEGEVATTEQLVPDAVLVDKDASGVIVGIEIIGVDTISLDTLVAGLDLS